MSEITEELVKSEFKKYKLFVVQEFIKSLPAPISNQGYKYVDVRTVDGYSVCVWGTSLQDLWSQFQRFVNLRMFI